MANAKQKLIIVESPAKAKTIGRYLGRGYKVEASQGHVCDLPKSQLGMDPEHDFDMKYITIRGRGDILSRIRKEAKNASHIYFATDPDREGEAISWHLYHVLGVDENTACRIEFNEVTKKAVQNAIKNPRKLDMGRIDAQQARRALDRLVGYKISPLLWAKVKKGLSAGRVQSVATRMVVDRENEINAFIPEEYWEITADCGTGSSRNRQIFKCRYVAIQCILLRHVTDTFAYCRIWSLFSHDGYTTLRWKEPSHQKIHHRCFTAAGWSKQAKDLSFIKPQIYIT